MTFKDVEYGENRRKFIFCFILVCESKVGAGEFCIRWFNTKKRNGIVQFKLWNLKLVGLRRSVGEAICALCQEEQS